MKKIKNFREQAKLLCVDDKTNDFAQELKRHYAIRKASKVKNMRLDEFAEPFRNSFSKRLENPEKRACILRIPSYDTFTLK